MTQVLDTLGKAARHGMVIAATCRCGRVQHYLACDVAYKLGVGRDPRSVRLRCSCGQRPKISLIERWALEGNAPIRRMAAANDGQGWSTISAGTVSLHTIQDYIDQHASLTAYCQAGGPEPRCRYAERLHLATLAMLLGTAFPVSHDTLVPRLRCPKCGSEDMVIMLAP